MWLFYIRLNVIIDIVRWHMAISEYEKLQEKVSAFNNDDEFYQNICKNLKKYRQEKYNEFKKKNFDKEINPFTTENMAALLEYSHTHYKRFESVNDSTKRIPLPKLFKISVILGRPIEDFLKNNENRDE